jgi:anaerobic magnesium-protoporphyrin IX monomethyl ester cyclase
VNVVLITPTPPDIDAFGVRTLSSVLKKEGVDTRIIFLPGGIEHLRFDSSYVYRYADQTLRQIAALCDDADLIGFSFMSQYFDRAAQTTEYLKKRFRTPVIWGGIHPTYRPEQCLEFCDMVCIGEGEYALSEVARKLSAGSDVTGVSGCWFNTPAGIRKNEPGPIVVNLDELPYVDYDLDNHYVFDRRTDDIIRLDKESMKEHFPKLAYFGNKHLVSYRTMTSRGCPHKCSFCASSATMRLRRRSVDNVIDELEKITARFDYLELIHFFDDTFFAAPVEYFEEFSEKYKKRIGRPFHAQCSPTTLSERKMELLLDAGLCYTEMGIQTGSERIKRMYRRVVPNEKLIEAAGLIGKYRSRMLVPDYHVILDNPWETPEDVLATLRLLLALPGKFRLQISSLIFFPGTELNRKAQEEGLLTDELDEVCRKPFTYPKGTYLNYLIYLSGQPFVPRSILRFLARDSLVGRFHRQRPSGIYRVLFALTEKVRLVAKGVAALARGDFGRIAHFFRLAR